MSHGFPTMVAGALGLAAAVGAASQLYADARARLANGPGHRTLRTSTGNVLDYQVRDGDPDLPTVVLEAGLLSSAPSWWPVLDRLDSDVRVLLYDRAGYRRSLRRCPEPYHFGESIGDLVDLIGAAGGEQCVLVGHSMGGYLAHRAAARLPGTAIAVILVDPTHPAQLHRSLAQRGGAAGTDLTVQLAPPTMLAGGGLLLDKAGLLAGIDSPGQRRLLGRQLACASAWRAARREWRYAYPFLLDGARPLDRLPVGVGVLAAGSTATETPEHLDLYDDYVRSGTGGQVETLDGSTHLSIIGSVRYAARVATRILQEVRG